ncbi:MAG: hypothetical protein NTZ09_17750 [Candidatus Hydrogenedentes bacterium]|nr:hypothetical protein [Candidatus Hydrogenedentota bacterium]
MFDAFELSDRLALFAAVPGAAGAPLLNGATVEPAYSMVTDAYRRRKRSRKASGVRPVRRRRATRSAAEVVSARGPLDSMEYA